MTKKMHKKSTGTILPSALFIVFDIVEAQHLEITRMAPVAGETRKSTAITKVNSQGLTIFSYITVQGIKPEQIQKEAHLILHKYDTENQSMGQHSMSLRGFYGKNIFSCRGFA